MKISDILTNGKNTLSCEVFPPKSTDAFDSVREATEKIAALKPAYMSVTYGAGGNGSRFTLPIAENIEKKYSVSVIHHLTCVGSTLEGIDASLDKIRASGIENVLALRGDVPDGSDPNAWAFRHAGELAAHVKAHGDICVGGACYPEGHPESASLEEDIRYLKEKVECGCDFLTTQLFFDNDVFFRFLERTERAGITAPITAGIMPLTSGKQINRMRALSGSDVPSDLTDAAARYENDPKAMFTYGVERAIKQISDLYLRGVKNVHLYSMNNARVSSEVMLGVRDFLV